MTDHTRGSYIPETSEIPPRPPIPRGGNSADQVETRGLLSETLAVLHLTLVEVREITEQMKGIIKRLPSERHGPL